MDTDPRQDPIRRYPVWDRTTRAFHWINVACVVVLAALGTMMLNGRALGLSHDGSTLVKTLHAYVGYVFALNLGWRFIWAFVGSRHARWRAILPAGGGFAAALRGQIRELRAGRHAAYVGHSPIGRIMITCLILLLVVQMMTGLLLAGTDLYLPPFGAYFAEWVTGGEAERLALLRPGSTDHVVAEAYDAMKAFRKPFKETHEFGFFVLVAFVLVHVVANVLEDARHATGQVSAMFSGVKFLSGKPADDDEA